MIKHNVQKKLLMIWLAYVVAFVLAVLFMIPKDVSAENTKPVARIDGTMNVRQGEKVYLDGTNSSDPGASGYPSLTYSWTLLSSPSDSTAVLSPSGAQVSFEADAAGTYKVKLVVNNGSSDSDPAYAEIRAAAGQ
jgi:K319L-like, PKD domain